MAQDVTQEIVSNLGRLTEKLGVGSAAGTIFGRLYFYGSMTQEKLRDDMGIGLSSVSQGLTVLEASGFVISGKDGRKRLYSANIEGNRKVLEDIMRFNLMPLADLIASMESGIKDKEAKAKLKLLREACTRCCSNIKKVVR